METHGFVWTEYSIESSICFVKDHNSGKGKFLPDSDAGGKGYYNDLVYGIMRKC